MKYWSKSLGLLTIFLVTIVATLASAWFGTTDLKLPTLAGGLSFIPTPLNLLLAIVTPTIVMNNRFQAAAKPFAVTGRLVRYLDLLVGPAAIAISWLLLIWLSNFMTVELSLIRNEALLYTSGVLAWQVKKSQVTIFTPTLLVLVAHFFGAGKSQTNWAFMLSSQVEQWQWSLIGFTLGASVLTSAVGISLHIRRMFYSTMPALAFARSDRPSVSE